MLCYLGTPGTGAICNMCTYQALWPQKCWVCVLYPCQMAHLGQPVYCGTQYCVTPVHTALFQCSLLVWHAAAHPTGSLPASCFPLCQAHLHKQFHLDKLYKWSNNNNFIHKVHTTVSTCTGSIKICYLHKCEYVRKLWTLFTNKYANANN
jgi:hypothetical protein